MLRPGSPWYLAFAVFAGALGLFSGQPIERCWGACAAAGYAAAAVILTATRARPAHTVAALIALACATVAPLAWQATVGLSSLTGEGSLTVVRQAGAQLLRHGTPYLPTDSLSHVLAYDPYEPLMAVFGLPGAAGLTGWAGDPRLWLALAGAAGVCLTFLISRQTRADALRCAAFAMASPVLSLQVATGGTDIPVMALLSVALAVTACQDRHAHVTMGVAAGTARRTRHADVTAGVVIGIACALKVTAWPAVPVLATMLAARREPKSAARFTLVSVLTAVAAMAASAPAALRAPGSTLQNAVLFPLGLTRHHTPAASPLPGHLLATAGPAGKWAAIALLAATALAFAVSLLLRPPRGTRAATLRLAAGLTLFFTLAPATRWGYYAYPLALAGWLALTRPDDGSPYSSEPAVVTPLESSTDSPEPAVVTPLESSSNSSDASSGADTPSSSASVATASSVPAPSAASVTAWSDGEASATALCEGTETTTGRSGRRWAKKNQTSPASVMMIAMYMFSRRPRKYSEESIRTDSSKIRNPE
jgi:hypothetical protein